MAVQVAEDHGSIAGIDSRRRIDRRRLRIADLGIHLGIGRTFFQALGSVHLVVIKWYAKDSFNNCIDQIH